MAYSSAHLWGVVAIFGSMLAGIHYTKLPPTFQGSIYIAGRCHGPKVFGPKKLWWHSFLFVCLKASSNVLIRVWHQYKYLNVRSKSLNKVFFCQHFILSFRHFDVGPCCFWQFQTRNPLMFGAHFVNTQIGWCNILIVVYLEEISLGGHHSWMCSFTLRK